MAREQAATTHSKKNKRGRPPNSFLLTDDIRLQKRKEKYAYRALFDQKLAKLLQQNNGDCVYLHNNKGKSNSSSSVLKRKARRSKSTVSHNVTYTIKSGSDKIGNLSSNSLKTIFQKNGSADKPSRQLYATEKLTFKNTKLDSEPLFLLKRSEDSIVAPLSSPKTVSDLANLRHTLSSKCRSSLEAGSDDSLSKCPRQDVHKERKVILGKLASENIFSDNEKFGVAETVLCHSEAHEAKHLTVNDVFRDTYSNMKPESVKNSDDLTKAQNKLMNKGEELDTQNSHMRRLPPLRIPKNKIIHSHDSELDEKTPEYPLKEGFKFDKRDSTPPADVKKGECDRNLFSEMSQIYSFSQEFPSTGKTVISEQSDHINKVTSVSFQEQGNTCEADPEGKATQSPLGKDSKNVVAGQQHRSRKVTRVYLFPKHRSESPQGNISTCTHGPDSCSTPKNNSGKTHNRQYGDTNYAKDTAEGIFEQIPCLSPVDKYNIYCDMLPSPLCTSQPPTLYPMFEDQRSQMSENDQCPFHDSVQSKKGSLVKKHLEFSRSISNGGQTSIARDNCNGLMETNTPWDIRTNYSQVKLKIIAPVSPRNSVLQGHESTRNSVPQGHESTINSVPQGHESTRNNVPQGHDITRNSVPQGHESTRNSVLQGHESTRNSMPQGHESTRNSMPQGHESTIKSVPQGHESTRSSMPQGHESTRNIMPQGHESTRNSVPQGHESTRNNVPQGHESTRNSMPQSNDNTSATPDKGSAPPGERIKSSLKSYLQEKPRTLSAQSEIKTHWNKSVRVPTEMINTNGEDGFTCSESQKMTSNVQESCHYQAKHSAILKFLKAAPSNTVGLPAHPSTKPIVPHAQSNTQEPQSGVTEPNTVMPRLEATNGIPSHLSVAAAHLQMDSFTSECQSKTLRQHIETLNKERDEKPKQFGETGTVRRLLVSQSETAKILLTPQATVTESMDKARISQPQSTDVTGKTVASQRQSADVTSEPVVSQRQSAKVTSEPVVSQRQSAKITEKTVVSQRQSADVTGKPVISQRQSARNKVNKTPSTSQLDVYTVPLTTPASAVEKTILTLPAKLYPEVKKGQTSDVQNIGPKIKRPRAKRGAGTVRPEENSVSAKKPRRKRFSVNNSSDKTGENGVLEDFNSHQRGVSEFHDSAATTKKINRRRTKNGRHGNSIVMELVSGVDNNSTFSNSHQLAPELELVSKRKGCRNRLPKGGTVCLESRDHAQSVRNGAQQQNSTHLSKIPVDMLLTLNQTPSNYAAASNIAQQATSGDNSNTKSTDLTVANGDTSFRGRGRRRITLQDPPVDSQPTTPSYPARREDESNALQETYESIPAHVQSSITYRDKYLDNSMQSSSTLHQLDHPQISFRSQTSHSVNLTGVIPYPARTKDMGDSHQLPFVPHSGLDSFRYHVPSSVRQTMGLRNAAGQVPPFISQAGGMLPLLPSAFNLPLQYRPIVLPMVASGAVAQHKLPDHIRGISPHYFGHWQAVMRAQQMRPVNQRQKPIVYPSWVKVPEESCTDGNRLSLSSETSAQGKRLSSTFSEVPSTPEKPNQTFFRAYEPPTSIQLFSDARHCRQISESGDRPVRQNSLSGGKRADSESPSEPQSIHAQTATVNVTHPSLETAAANRTHKISLPQVTRNEDILCEPLDLSRHSNREPSENKDNISHQPISVQISQFSKDSQLHNQSSIQQPVQTNEVKQLVTRRQTASASHTAEVLPLLQPLVSKLMSSAVSEQVRLSSHQLKFSTPVKHSISAPSPIVSAEHYISPVPRVENGEKQRLRAESVEEVTRTCKPNPTRAQRAISLPTIPTWSDVQPNSSPVKSVLSNYCETHSEVQFPPTKNSVSPGKEQVHLLDFEVDTKTQQTGITASSATVVPVSQNSEILTTVSVTLDDTRSLENVIVTRDVTKTKDSLINNPTILLDDLSSDSIQSPVTSVSTMVNETTSMFSFQAPSPKTTRAFVESSSVIKDSLISLATKPSSVTLSPGVMKAKETAPTIPNSSDHALSLATSQALTACNPDVTKVTESITTIPISPTDSQVFTTPSPDGIKVRESTTVPISANSTPSLPVPSAIVISNSDVAKVKESIPTVVPVSSPLIIEPAGQISPPPRTHSAVSNVSTSSHDCKQAPCKTTETQSKIVGLPLKDFFTNSPKENSYSSLLMARITSQHKKPTENYLPFDAMLSTGRSNDELELVQPQSKYKNLEFEINNSLQRNLVIDLTDYDDDVVSVSSKDSHDDRWSIDASESDKAPTSSTEILYSDISDVIEDRHFPFGEVSDVGNVADLCPGSIDDGSFVVTSSVDTFILESPTVNHELENGHFQTFQSGERDKPRQQNIEQHNQSETVTKNDINSPRSNPFLLTATNLQHLDNVCYYQQQQNHADAIPIAKNASHQPHLKIVKASKRIMAKKVENAVASRVPSLPESPASASKAGTSASHLARTARPFDELETNLREPENTSPHGEISSNYGENCAEPENDQVNYDRTLTETDNSTQRAAAVLLELSTNPLYNNYTVSLETSDSYQEKVYQIHPTLENDAAEPGPNGDPNMYGQSPSGTRKTPPRNTRRVGRPPKDQVDECTFRSSEAAHLHIDMNCSQCLTPTVPSGQLQTGLVSDPENYAVPLEYTKSPHLGLNGPFILTPARIPGYPPLVPPGPLWRPGPMPFLVPPSVPLSTPNFPRGRLDPSVTRLMRVRPQVPNKNYISRDDDVFVTEATSHFHRQLSLPNENIEKSPDQNLDDTSLPHSRAGDIHVSNDIPHATSTQIQVAPIQENMYSIPVSCSSTPGSTVVSNVVSISNSVGSAGSFNTWMSSSQLSSGSSNVTYYTCPTISLHTPVAGAISVPVVSITPLFQETHDFGIRVGPNAPLVGKPAACLTALNSVHPVLKHPANELDYNGNIESTFSKKRKHLSDEPVHGKVHIMDFNSLEHNTETRHESSFPHWSCPQIPAYNVESEVARSRKPSEEVHQNTLDTTSDEQRSASVAAGEESVSEHFIHGTDGSETRDSGIIIDVMQDYNGNVTETVTAKTSHENGLVILSLQAEYQGNRYNNPSNNSSTSMSTSVTCGDNRGFHEGPWSQPRENRQSALGRFLPADLHMPQSTAIREAEKSIVVNDPLSFNNQTPSYQEKEVEVTHILAHMMQSKNGQAPS